MDPITLDETIFVARSGLDYDIAIVFLTMFPQSHEFSDKEISIKLSTNVYNEFLLAARNWIYRAMNTNNSADQTICSKNARCMDKVATKLRSHASKNAIIKEIKMIR